MKLLVVRWAMHFSQMVVGAHRWDTMSSQGWDSGIASQELSHVAEHASAFRSSIQEQTNESLEKLLRCYSIWPQGVQASRRLQELYARLVGLMRMNCASIKLPLPAGALPFHPRRFPPLSSLLLDPLCLKRARQRCAMCRRFAGQAWRVRAGGSLGSASSPHNAGHSLLLARLPLARGLSCRWCWAAD